MGHPIGLKRCKGLRKQNDVEAWQGLHWRVLGDVSLNLAACSEPQWLIFTGDKRFPINKRNLPEGHISQHILLDLVHRVPVSDQILPRECFALAYGHNGP